MSEWKEVKLGDIADIQTGPFGSQLHMRDYTLTGTPIITVEHLGDNRIIHQNLPYVGDEDKERLKKYILKMGDIVFSRVGSVDRRAYVSEFEDGWLFSGRCLRVRCLSKRMVSSKFLSYYFGQESFKEYIRKIAVGATMPSINTEILAGVEITIPPLSEQKAIAGILSSLDDKIDLLHRNNKTLEALAETIFRQWFMEGKEDTWTQTSLNDVLTLNYGKALPERNRKNGVVPVYSSAGLTGWHDQFLVAEGGIVIGRKGTIGTIYLVDGPFFCIDTAYYTRQVDVTLGLFFTYFLLKTLDLNEFNEDSAVPGLNRNTLYSQEFRRPPIKLVEKFDILAKTVFQRIQANSSQIRTLESLRDTLLPKLISGEIRVPV